MKLVESGYVWSGVQIYLHTLVRLLNGFSPKFHVLELPNSRLMFKIIILTSIKLSDYSLCQSNLRVEDTHSFKYTLCWKKKNKGRTKEKENENRE